MGDFLFNDFGEYTYEDLDDWDKLGFSFGFGGIRRTIV